MHVRKLLVTRPLMAKLLVAMAFVSALVLIADAASARPRGMRASRSASQPATFKRSHDRTENKATKRREAAPPRSWVIAVPSRVYRTPRNQNADQSYRAMPTEAGAGAPFAAAAPPAQAHAAAPPEKAAEQPPPVRMVVLNPDPPRSQPAAGPKLPHHFEICYWNQAGQCIER
jgi:hypothetical protein